MSDPSISNIDRWLFELMEGNLSPEQEVRLEAFLLRHPELDIDRDAWEQAKLIPVETQFPNQQKLVKRRPVGIYSVCGFLFMALLVAIGIANNRTDFSTVNESSGNSEINGVQNIVNSKKNLITQNRISTTPHHLNSIPKKDLTFSISGLYDSNGEDEVLKSIGKSLGQTYLNISSGEIIQHDLIPVGRDNNDPQFLDEAFLKTEKVKLLEIEENQSNFSVNTGVRISNPKIQSSEYRISFGSKVNRLGRKIQRMLDNPVALKNMNDPHYHVPGMLPVDINFSSVGALLATRVQTISRAQWLGENNQQMINGISIDGYSYAMRGGIGFTISHNYYGTGGIQQYESSLIYSPKFSITREIVLEPSIRFKMGSKSIDGNLIPTGSVIEYDRKDLQQFYLPGQQPIGKTLWYRDMGLGLMVNTKWFFAGIRQDNLFRHFDNIYSTDLSSPKRMEKHFVATIGTDYESAKEKITISPYLVFQSRNNFQEGWVGFNLRYHWISFGGAISSNMDPAASLGVKFKHFMLQYNADYTFSNLNNRSQLSHQLTLRVVTKPSRIGQRLMNQ